MKPSEVYALLPTENSSKCLSCNISFNLLMRPMGTYKISILLVKKLCPRKVNTLPKFTLIVTGGARTWTHVDFRAHALNYILYCLQGSKYGRECSDRNCKVASILNMCQSNSQSADGFQRTS